jgi:hypothetical protein
MYALEENGGWSGVHTESGVWTTLFGLLMWPVLFAPVPDVFRTRFQCTVDILSRFFQFSLIVNGCVCVCVLCSGAVGSRQRCVLCESARVDRATTRPNPTGRLGAALRRGVVPRRHAERIVSFRMACAFFELTCVASACGAGERCVGVLWGAFGKEQLLSIAECIGRTQSP